MSNPTHPFGNLPIPPGERGNVGLICKVCSIYQRVDAKVLEHPPAWFVGKYCKLRFDALGDAGQQMEEGFGFLYPISEEMIADCIHRETP